MPLIRCKLGYAETPMGGQIYTFDRDEAGRYVANVYDERHVTCFISAGTYEEVPPLPAGWRRGDDVPEATAPQQAAPSIPALLTGTAFLTSFNEASAPDLFEHEDNLYSKTPWPASIGITKGDIAEGIDDDTLRLDENQRLTITVKNGVAHYTLIGAFQDAFLYSLEGGSVFVEPPKVDDKPPSLIDVKGIGPATLKKLEAGGIDTLDKLLALGEEQRKALDAEYGGAPTNGHWFEQAAELVAKSK